MIALVPKSTFAERPLQARPFDVQFAELGMQDGSPIEISFAKALLRLLIDPAEYGPPAYISLFLPRGTIKTIREFPPIKRGRVEGVIYATPECGVGAYRADFCFYVKAYGKRSKPLYGAVECDGHNFHDKDRKQAGYDRQRDRFFQERGITVLRYPGYEVHDNPEKCARNALNVLMRMSASGEI